MFLVYGRSSAKGGCGVNDGIHRDTCVCDNKSNGGGFDPPRWAEGGPHQNAGGGAA